MPSRLKAHIFVCENERPTGDPRGCCVGRGSKLLMDAFKKALATHGLTGQVRANRAGCLDACQYGPSVVIYPEGIWYAGVRPEDAAEIVESHLINGKPVDRLRMPGK